MKEKTSGWRLTLVDLVELASSENGLQVVGRSLGTLESCGVVGRMHMLWLPSDSPRSPTPPHAVSPPVQKPRVSGSQVKCSNVKYLESHDPECCRKSGTVGRVSL